MKFIRIFFSLIIISTASPAANLISIESGNYQSGYPGTELRYPLEIKVMDTNGKPVPEAKVKFEILNAAAVKNAEFADSKKSVFSTATSEDGTASVKLILPDEPGTVLVQAESSGKKNIFESTAKGFISSDFILKEWEIEYISDKNSLSKTVKSISKKNKGSDFIFYHKKTLHDNFEISVDWNLKKSNIAGLLILNRSKYGINENSFTMIAAEKKDTGKTIIHILDFVNGTKRYSYNTYTENDYGTFRIVYDKVSSCMRFYNSMSKVIDGKKMTGWFEFPSIETENDIKAAGLFIVPDDFVEIVYTFKNFKLKINPVFDNPDYNTGFKAVWRDYTFSGITDSAIVVTFDPEISGFKNEKFVFWKQANYIPWWHLSDSACFTNEFVEIWGGGAEGCHEPMSDRLLRWSYAEIIKSTSCQIIVRWHYVLANYEYIWWGKKKNKPEVDEYYTFYPDGTCIRKITYHPVGVTRNELSEMILVNAGGTRPGEHVKQTALSIFNLKGDYDNYTWDLKNKKNNPVLNPKTKFWNEIIFKVNFKNTKSPYEVFAQGPKQRKFIFPSYPMEIDTWEFTNSGYGGYEFDGDFNAFSHWPISKQPYEDPSWSAGRYARETSHTSFIGINAGKYSSVTTSWAALIGISDKDADILKTAESWVYPGEIMLNSSSELTTFINIDYFQKKLVFEIKEPAEYLSFNILPENNNNYIKNPVIEIKGWKSKNTYLFIDKILKNKKEYIISPEKDSIIIFINKMVPVPSEITVCKNKEYPESLKNIDVNNIALTYENKKQEEEPVPELTKITKGNFIFVPLPYNQDMISFSPNYSRGTGWDLPGDIFPEFSSEIVTPEKKIPFKMIGADDKLNCFEIREETLKISRKDIYAIHFLGLSHSDAKPSKIKIRYSDNTEKDISFFISDWWAPDKNNAGKNEELAIKFPYHNEVDGKKPEPSGLWAKTILTDPVRELKEIKFEFNDKIRIFAMTLEIKKGSHKKTAKVEVEPLKKAPVPELKSNVKTPLNFHFIELPYNCDMISGINDLKNGTGKDFPQEEFPEFSSTIISPGTSIPFKMINASPYKNCFALENRNIKINMEKISRIHFLGTALGFKKASFITVEYGDGREEIKSLSLAEWWDPDYTKTKTGNELALRFSQYHTYKGTQNMAVGIWRTSITTNPGKIIRSIGFTANNNVRIFAITLEE